MARRAGTADLPLHGGHIPKWLADRMTRLGAVISEAIVHHYGRDELLRRLAHPFWFQSFGAVMGMDWHSSGITTSVIGALKRGLAPLGSELGVHVCGGRGKHSRRTPQELLTIGERVGLDGVALAKASRLIAKVDSAAVQDGFDLYLHGFIVTDDGKWVVVQQGMNGERRQARRYHWLSEGLKSFVEEPHAAIDGLGQGEIVNLTDRRAAPSRRGQLDILQALGPEEIARQLRGMEARDQEPIQSPTTVQPLLPHLIMPTHHDVRPSDVFERRLCGNLAAAADCGPTDFAELLLVPGVGPRTVRALAMVAEVVHGAPYRFTDPARFSIAHGGKDRHPFPVPLRVYDQTIQVMKSAVQKAKLGRTEELGALKRLDDQARQLERHATGAMVQELIAQELAALPILWRPQRLRLGARSSFGENRAQRRSMSRTSRRYDAEQVSSFSDATIAYYDRFARAFWNGTRDHDVSQNYTAFLDAIEGEAPYSILDLGCGPGRDLSHFRSLGHEAVGLDGSKQFVAMARAHSQCEVLNQDFLAMQLPESRFDGVFANASLFHVPSQELPRVLLELFKTLKPRGVLFSSNPRGSNEEGLSDDRYVCFLDLDTWRDYVASAGFAEVAHYYRPPRLPRHRQPWLATVWRKR